jgi:hypothetical protein
MSNFIEDFDGNLVNVDHVVQVVVRRNHKGDLLHYCKFTGDRESVRISQTTFEGLKGKVVPAQPGYMRLWYFYSEQRENDYVEQRPIIAWRIDAENYHEPVTIGGCDDADDSAILCPNLKVATIFSEQQWEDIIAWRQTCRERAEKHRKWEKEAAEKAKAGEAA